MTEHLCAHCNKAVRSRPGHWQVITSAVLRDYHERPGCTEAAEADAKMLGVSLWHTTRNDISRVFTDTSPPLSSL